MDSYTGGPDRRVEEARESLIMRIEELGRRLREARNKLDIGAHIAAHPLAATGVAFAVGLLLGFRRSARKRADDDEAKRSLASALIAGLGAIGVRLAKDFALRKFSDTAFAWWEGDDVSPTERRASHEPSVEAFLEH
jgi:hypothetical protein